MRCTSASPVVHDLASDARALLSVSCCRRCLTAKYAMTSRAILTATAVGVAQATLVRFLRSCPSSSKSEGALGILKAWISMTFGVGKVAAAESEMAIGALTGARREERWTTGIGCGSHGSMRQLAQDWACTNTNSRSADEQDSWTRHSVCRSLRKVIVRFPKIVPAKSSTVAQIEDLRPIEQRNETG